MIVIWVLTVVSNLYSQKTKAILVFNDGTKLEGLGKITVLDQVKFRKKKGDKRVRYSFDELEYAKIYEPSGVATYVKRYVKNQEFPKILEVVRKGKVTLYKTLVEGYNTVPMAGGGGQFGGGFGVGGGFTTQYSISNYYVQKEKEKEVTHLGSTSLFSKNFKKAASKYFSDCTELVDKIQNKEYRKRDIEDIVWFYNQKCN